MVINHVNNAQGQRLTNGWNLFFDNHLTLWKKDEQYLLLDMNKEVVLIFAFKREELIIEKVETWRYQLKINSDKQRLTYIGKETEFPVEG